MQIRHVTIENPYNGASMVVDIACWYGESRSGFNHFAECPDFPEIGKVKVHYINRTWEAHPYDTVVANLLYKIKCLNDTFRKAEAREARRRAKERKAAMKAAMEARQMQLPF